jgi:hypothetical protein
MVKVSLLTFIKKTCTCNFLKLVGIPCRLVVAALGYTAKNPLDFVDECYSRDKYAQCYGFGVSPINGVDMWPKPDGVEEIILPPLYKKGPRRPRKLTIREVGEDGSRRRRRGVIYLFTTCGLTGHNA